MLTLADVLAASGVADLRDVRIIRHTFNPAEELKGLEDVTPENVMSYTRRQGRQKGHKLGPQPDGTWLVFIEDGARRARFFTTYENRGELKAEGTGDLRFFDLHETDLLNSLRNRLVVNWGADPVNWAKRGPSAAFMPVLEIADPTTVPFPGFDRVRITYDVLQSVVSDARYAEWRAALKSVNGIYLIADRATGQLFVGKGDGPNGIFGRWATYSRDGHGGNAALRELAWLDPTQPQKFVFSILRVFAPNVLPADMNAAEAHYKAAFLTREFGYNRN